MCVCVEGDSHNLCHASNRKEGKTGYALSTASLLHDPQLVPLVVDVLGQMSVARDALDLRVVLELLLQLLAVVNGRLLSGGQLH